MACCRDLKTCLDLPAVEKGCAHVLRVRSTFGCGRGTPEYQGVLDAPHVGFFVLNKASNPDEQIQQIEKIPRKEARCYCCQTNFYIIWEKYNKPFDWTIVVNRRYRECMFISYKTDLREEFECQDVEYNQHLLGVGAVKETRKLAADKGKVTPENAAIEEAGNVVPEVVVDNVPLDAKVLEQGVGQEPSNSDGPYSPVWGPDEENMETDYDYFTNYN